VAVHRKDPDQHQHHYRQQEQHAASHNDNKCLKRQTYKQIAPSRTVPTLILALAIMVAEPTPSNPSIPLLLLLPTICTQINLHHFYHHHHHHHDNQRRWKALKSVQAFPRRSEERMKLRAPLNLDSLHTKNVSVAPCHLYTWRMLNTSFAPSVA
jgi:hypothetical protein